jgi:alpha-galactosidase
MPLPTSIVVIGAGSASFGGNTLSALIRSKKLRGSSLALADHNPTSLDIVKRLAERLNREWDAEMKITAHLRHSEALEGAQFVVSAIEVGAREGLWRSDYEIPLKYGVHQPYAENGGPGGFAHAARNIGPVMQIVRDMERTCPDAWFINFTNPMVRICDAVNRHSRVRAVGLCHQIYAGYSMVGVALAKELGIEVPPELTGMHASVDQVAAHESLKKQTIPLIDIKAAGLNHFTWVLSIKDRRTGEDLYALFRYRFFELDPNFEPLTRDVFSAFGLFPVPGDTHLCEYLPWVSDPLTKPWEKYNIRLYDWDLMAAVRDFELDRLSRMADGTVTVEGLLETDSEGALEMIENIAGAGDHYHLAANLPNRGQISNLPSGATVETPVMVNGAGVHPVQVGDLPEPIAELCRRESTVAQLCVDAAVEGDREKALQCLLLDPMITDIQAAKNIINDYLSSYKEYLPQFWNQ